MATPLQLMSPLIVSNELIESLGMDDPGVLVKMDKQKMIELANAAIVQAGGTPLSPLERAGSYSLVAAACIERAGDAGGVVEPDDFPNAATTGVQTGITLTTYSGPQVINTNNVTIENMHITYDTGIEVHGDNCTIRNCRIDAFDFFGVNGGEDADNLLVEYCDIVGKGVNGIPNSGILGRGTFRYNDISQVCLGIQLVGTATVNDNYIHDLAGGQEEPHYDGIMSAIAVTDSLFEHNAIWMPPTSGTAAVFIVSQYGIIDGIVVRNNLMRGSPSYTVYSTVANFPISGVEFIDNVMEEGDFGYFNILDNTVTWTNNTHYATGALIPGPP